MTAPAAPMRVLVVGRGKVAHGIRHAARSRPTQAVCRLRTLTQVRATDLAWAELVLLTVPDGAIRAAAESLAPRVSARLPVLHLSGSRPVSEASACPEHGGLHPLASFASAQQPPSLSGMRFALGGTARALRMGRRLVRALEKHFDEEEGEGWAVRLSGVDEPLAVSRRQLAAVRELLNAMA